MFLRKLQLLCEGFLIAATITTSAMVTGGVVGGLHGQALTKAVYDARLEQTFLFQPIPAVGELEDELVRTTYPIVRTLGGYDRHDLGTALRVGMQMKIAQHIGLGIGSVVGIFLVLGWGRYVVTSAFGEKYARKNLLNATWAVRDRIDVPSDDFKSCWVLARKSGLIRYVAPEFVTATLTAAAVPVLFANVWVGGGIIVVAWWAFPNIVRSVADDILVNRDLQELNNNPVALSNLVSRYSRDRDEQASNDWIQRLKDMFRRNDEGDGPDDHGSSDKKRRPW